MLQRIDLLDGCLEGVHRDAHLTREILDHFRRITLNQADAIARFRMEDSLRRPWAVPRVP
jgi:hypothetical protein